jgi:hypothetical protein
MNLPRAYRRNGEIFAVTVPFVPLRGQPSADWTQNGERGTCTESPGIRLTSCPGFFCASVMLIS